MASYSDKVDQRLCLCAAAFCTWPIQHIRPAVHNTLPILRCMRFRHLSSTLGFLIHMPCAVVHGTLPSHMHLFLHIVAAGTAKTVAAESGAHSLMSPGAASALLASLAVAGTLFILIEDKVGTVGDLLYGVL